MAELRFSGRSTVAFPLYLNPNIWTVVGSDPETSPVAPPVLNQTAWIWCSVKNTGKQPVEATVKFFVCNPSTVLTPATSPLGGQSSVALAAGETKEVLCVTPWIPAWINEGHECIICEVSGFSDPSPFTPSTPWNLQDRHVAQRNVQVLEMQRLRSRTALTAMGVLGIMNQKTKINIRPAPKELFFPLLASLGEDDSTKRNITDACQFGVIADHRCGDPAPDPREIGKQIQLQLEPNQQAGVTAVVHVPNHDDHEGDKTRGKAAAGLFLVEQVDGKEKVIGGVAILVVIGEIKAQLPVGSQAATVPVSIPYRPYSTDIRTRLMTADGFFIVNLGVQSINLEMRNDGSGSLRDLSIYVEGSSDPKISISRSVQDVLPASGALLPSASFKSQFVADFTEAKPGETIVSFIVQDKKAVTHKRIIKKIFVTGVDFDPATKTFSVFLPPQGTMEIHVKTAIIPAKEPCVCPGDDQRNIIPFPVFIKSGTLNWVPSPPYAGVHGPLPFNDPWWKLAFLLAAAILAGAGVVTDLFSHHGKLTGGKLVITGTFEESDPSIKCCPSLAVSNPTPKKTTWDYVVAGLYGAASAALSAAAASDDFDLHFRGQEKTAPNKGELTTGEKVSFTVDVKDPPSPGKPFRGSIDWNYERSVDSGRALKFATKNDYANPHYLKSYDVQVDEISNPSRHFIHDQAKRPLTICTQFIKPDGGQYKGPELYVTAVLWSDQGVLLFTELRDDGWNSDFLDQKPNSGNYCMERDIFTEEDVNGAGNWYLFVFAQKVNTVLEGTDPITAAKTIGGFVLTPQMVVNFGSKPCQLNHDAVITVV
jgi:hypothetical protein